MISCYRVENVEHMLMLHGWSLQVPMDEVFNKNAKKIKEFGPFGVQAEISNGRAAMIGLALMLLLEGTSGAAFFL